MEIKHTDERINYYGRIDHKEDGAYFYFPSTSAEVRFKGTEISAVINANIVWGTTALGYVIDGRMGQIPLSAENNGKAAERMSGTIVLHHESYPLLLKRFKVRMLA